MKLTSPSKLFNSKKVETSLLKSVTKNQVSKIAIKSLAVINHMISLALNLAIGCVLTPLKLLLKTLFGMRSRLSGDLNLFPVIRQH